MQKSKLIIAGIIALAVIASAWLLARGIKHFSGGDPKITVTGMSEREIKSDLIVWKLNVSVTNKNQSEAYTEHKKSKEGLLAYLKSHGIEDEQIRFSSTSISEKYDEYYSDQANRYIREYKGYELSSNIIITSNQVDAVERLYENISDLVGSELSFTAYSPSYYYTQLNTLKMEMLEEASSDAYNRAHIIAKGGKGSLGKIASSSMGVFQIVGLNSDEEYSWSGAFNTSSKMKTARVTVRSSFEVN